MAVRLHEEADYGSLGFRMTTAIYIILMLASTQIAGAASVTFSCGTAVFSNGIGAPSQLHCPGANVGGSVIDSVAVSYFADYAGGTGFNSITVNFTPTNGISGGPYTLIGAGIPPAHTPITVQQLQSGSSSTYAGFDINVNSQVNFGAVLSSAASAAVTYCYAAANPSVDCPVIPLTFTPGNWTFTGPSGHWYDPPLVSGFDYVGTSGTLFSKITLPGGFSSVNVLDGSGFSTLLGSFAAGSTVDFIALTGGAIGAFRIAGINPTVDAADQNAYPVQVFFTTSNGSFSQTALTPEPATFTLAIAGLALLVYSRGTKRQPEC